MTTSWESPYPPTAHQNNSRWAGTPGVYMNLEFRVALSENQKSHGGSLTYASKNMMGRLNTNTKDSSIPSILTPGRVQPSQRPRYQQIQQERTRGLAIKTTNAPPERGRSAPPSMSRDEPVSPLTPISPILNRATFPQQMPTERPMPTTPGRFRLGADDLPWSTPTFYWNGQSPISEPSISSPPARHLDDFTSPPGRHLEDPQRIRNLSELQQAMVSPPSRRLEDLSSPPSRRLEDPQRVHNLSELQQAMMTVDSLSHDVWDPWTWDSVGDMPRGPRSIGWAVCSNDTPEASDPPTVSLSSPTSPVSPPPPPAYVVSQWEHSCGRRAAAPATAAAAAAATQRRPMSTG